MTIKTSRKNSAFFKKPGFFLLVSLLCNLQLGTATYTTLYQPDQTSFNIFVNQHPVSESIFSLFVLPGSSVEVRASSADHYALKKDDLLTTSMDGRWSWAAPDQPGLTTVRVQNTQTEEAITVNIFVMAPASQVKHGYLNGFHIGSYPKKPLKNLPIYVAPAGFVEITPENRTVKVSPHFRLNQFLCKQSGSYPQYVVLQERLLEKLEALLKKTNDAGFACDTFHVMSGYRTPYYNRSIGNVAYSRHQWGDAADIFIDQNPPDGVMDDLNGDGKIDKADSNLLARLVEDVDVEETALHGGIGTYKSTRSHGPFVHVDARGITKTW